MNNTEEIIELRDKCTGGIHDAFTAELKAVDEVQHCYRFGIYHSRNSANERNKATRTAQLINVALNSRGQIDFS
jgi:hypothetical protein